jgi:hypothetical protein
VDVTVAPASSAVSPAICRNPDQSFQLLDAMSRQAQEKLLIAQVARGDPEQPCPDRASPRWLLP